MRPFPFLVGLLLIAVVLWDAFETVVLPRTVTRRLRLAALYFQATWNPWARVARMFEPDSRRERFLAIYGPLSLLGLLMVWALGLILGFAVLQWAAGSQLQTSTGKAAFLDDLYAVYPEARGLVTETVLLRMPRMLPYVAPGRAALQPALEQPLGRLHLVGDYLGGVYTETAISSGQAAATSIREDLAR